ncbi:hypothetical protein GF325_03185 [Candidatus Bathyarchaeota archaeon]|nr:hypothetical protein [Candidatus Bathyarchaeota archaeon]
MDSVLTTAFTTAINNFGLKIFPDEELEDIVFTKHHIFFQKFKILDKHVLFLVIHDKHEQHFNLKKINQEIYWQVKQKFSHVFQKELIDINEIKEQLLGAIETIFVKERRRETPL